MLRGIKKCALFLQTVCNFVNGALVQHQEWDGKESTITRKVEDGKLVVVSARHCAGVTDHEQDRRGREGRKDELHTERWAGSPVGLRPHSAVTFQGSVGKPHTALGGACFSISLKRGITLAKTKSII